MLFFVVETDAIPLLGGNVRKADKRVMTSEARRNLGGPQIKFFVFSGDS